MRTRLGVAAKAGDEAQVQIELIHEPLDVGTAVLAQDLHELGLLGTALQGVGSEDLLGVRDALLALRASVGTIDAARGLCRVATSENESK